MQAQPPNHRYAVYTRVATKNQTSTASLNAQAAAAARYVATNGGEIVATFEDEGKSGLDDDRPALCEVIQQATHPDKPFDAILVYDFDRFTRSRSFLFRYRQILAEHGVQLISITQPTSAQRADELLQSIMKYVDDAYRATIRERRLERNR